MISLAASAADYPAPKEGDWIARDFRFHTGEVLPEVRLHYRTIGTPEGIPVVVLHGTGSSGQSMLTPAFAGELFGPGQPLDAAKYFIILPDALGHGNSIEAVGWAEDKIPAVQLCRHGGRAVSPAGGGLGIKHVRMVIGNSMGGMNVWLWGEKYPGYMDVLVPMASQPTAMASRNWILRRIMLELIRQDPEYANGNYTTQPHSVKLASAFFAFATSGGTLNYQKQAPTRAQADKLADTRLAAPMTSDANDFLWQWGSSGDYDASPDLEKIEAPLLLINAADDERNPPETGITESAMKRVKNGKLLLIPASEQTSGHATTGNAKFYKQALQALLDSAPQKGM